MNTISQKEFTQIVADSKKIVLLTIQKFLFKDLHYLIDDTAQEVYLRVYKYILKSSLSSIANFNGWIYTIAKNESIRMNRKHKREIEKNKKIEIELSQKEKINNQNLEPNSDVEIIYTYMIKLPVKYKEIFDLYSKGYPEKEISILLAIPLGTVKSRIHRAKDKITRLIQTEGKS